MSLYSDVLDIVQKYMGIVAEEYIRRRCKAGFDMENPVDLKKEHIERLVQGIDVTAGAYISEEDVKMLIEEILRLGDKKY